MAEDKYSRNRQKVYDLLKSEGYSDDELGGSAEALFSDKSNGRIAYDALIDAGYDDLGEYSDFDARLFAPDVQPEAVLPEQPAAPIETPANIQPVESVRTAEPVTQEAVDEGRAMFEERRAAQKPRTSTIEQAPDEVKIANNRADLLSEQTKKDVSRFGTGNENYSFEEAVSAGKEYAQIAPEIEGFNKRMAAFNDKYRPLEDKIAQIKAGTLTPSPEEYKQLQAEYAQYEKDSNALSEIAKKYDSVMDSAPGKEYKDISDRMNAIAKKPKSAESAWEYAQENAKLQRNPIYRASLGDNAPSEDEINSDLLQGQIAYIEEKLKTAKGDDRKELKKAFSDAKEALYANPYYKNYLNDNIAESKALNEDIASQKAAYLDEKRKGYGGNVPPGFFSQRENADPEIQRLDAAARMNDDAIREWQKPTKYDDSKGAGNTVKGLADWATDSSTWTFGLQDFVDDIAVVRPVLDKVEKIAGSLNPDVITDAMVNDLEKQLTPGEEAVLTAYFNKIGAQAAKGADTSIGYQIGQGIGDMITLGIEMAATGGVGGAAHKAIDKAGMKAMRKLLEKKLYRKVAKSGAGRVALWATHKAGRDVAETLVRIPFMPSTYKALGEGAVTLDEGYHTRSLTEYAPEAMWNQFVEQLTEVSNGFAFPLMGRIVKTPGMEKFFTQMVGKNGVRAFRSFMERGDIKLLDDAMLGSFGGEWEEELLGAVIHSVTDDPKALRDFFSAEQQLVLLGTLAPLPVSRGVTGGVRLAVPAADAAYRWNRAEAELKRLGLDEGRISRIKEVIDNSSAPEGARAIMEAMRDAGASRQTASKRGFVKAEREKSNEVLAGSIDAIDAKAYGELARYFWSAQQKRAAGLMGEIEQDRKVAAKRTELEQRYGGAFYHPYGDEGEEVVETATMRGPDGSIKDVFITSETPGESGEMAYVAADGSKGFVRQDEIGRVGEDGSFEQTGETVVTPINRYLAQEVMNDAQIRQAEGVVNDAVAINQSLREQVESLGEVKYKGKTGTISPASSSDEAAVFVPDDSSDNVVVPWDELASENGIEAPQVMTEDEKVAVEADAVAQRFAEQQQIADEIRGVMDSGFDEAVINTDEGPATVVDIIEDTINPEEGTAQFTVIMPDGTRNVTMRTAIAPVLSQLRGEAAPEAAPEVAPEPEPAPAPAQPEVAKEAPVETKEETPAIPLDKNGEKIYDAPGVSVEDALEDLYSTDGLTDEDVDEYIRERAKEAEKGRNPKRGNMSPAAWGQAKKEAERVAEFWRQMKEFADANTAARKEEEKEQERRIADLEKYGVDTSTFDLTPQTLEEAIAEYLGHSEKLINLDDAIRETLGRSKNGRVPSELFRHVGNGGILVKNGGMPIADVAADIVRDFYGDLEHEDAQYEARTMIIDMLVGKTKSEMRDVIFDNRLQQAIREKEMYENAPEETTVEEPAPVAEEPEPQPEPVPEPEPQPEPAPAPEPETPVEEPAEEPAEEPEAPADEPPVEEPETVTDEQDVAEETTEDALGENETQEIRDAVDAIVSGKDKKKRTINDSLPADYEIAGKDVNSYIRDRYDKFKAPLEKRREELRQEYVAYRTRVEEQAKRDILARNPHIKEDNPYLPDYVSEEADKRLKNDAKFNELDSQITAIDNEIGNYQERRYNAFAAISEIYAKTVEKPSESPENSVTLEGGEEAREKFSNIVSEQLLAAVESGERPFKSISDLRRVAREAGMEVDEKGATDILIQELVEVALVKAARSISEQNGIKSKKAFEKICRLYDMQPTISMRSSQRVAMQQYSTPLPMAFVAQRFAYNGSMNDILEPTAGNGMLVFGIPTEKVHANELDETRKSNLDKQGFKEVTQNDATEPFSGEYDGVIANPPFGSHEAVQFDGKSISGLDPVITLRALDAMKDNGRAAIIIGGNVEWGDNGAWKTKKAFFSYLYDHYNVKGVVNMAGDMYSRQGTSYPTMMILIDGRRSDEERAASTVYPPVRDKAQRAATTNDELYDIVTDILNDNRKTDGNEVVRTERERKPSDRSDQTGSLFPGHDSGESSADGTDGGRGDNGGGSVQTPGRNDMAGENRPGGEVEERTDGERPGAVRDVSDTEPGEVAEQTADSGDSRVQGDSGRGESDRRGSGDVPLGDAGREQSESVPGGESAVREPVRVARKIKDRILSYIHHSRARSLESVAPAAMVEAMDAAIQKIEKEQGRTIDEFVMDELGYESTEQLHKALAAEQIDSVAMAIYQMKNGKAMIIGDQTGVGKGRQMAALIRWANRQGKKPIFMTQKAGLFSDIYRDLRDIGSGSLKPLILNAVTTELDEETGKRHFSDTAGVMLDEDGNLIYQSPGKAELGKIVESGKVPDGYDFVVLTYSQLGSGDEQSRKESKKKAKDSSKTAKANAKAAFIRKVADGNYVLLDESHTAAGDSNSGAFLRSIIRAVSGVTFSSATFAKRPDTMPLYAIKSAMSEANVEPDKLIGMIEKGGVTLQEIMARALTGSGQMVRRERDMSDVKTDWKTVDDPATAKKARENYDRAIEIFNKIIQFQRNFITPVIKEISNDLAEMASSAGETSGTKNFGVDNPPFVSQTYNFTKQLMLALKAEAIVNEVVKEIKAGRHPVIALENTYESGLDAYAIGDKIEDTSFSGGLLRSLGRILQYTVTDPEGKKSQEFLTPEELGPEAAKQYYALQQEIKEATKGIFLSPLDLIKQKLSEQGYKVGEVTGRKTQVVKEDDGYYRRERAADAKQAVRDFNSGASDVIIINKAGSTGISLHSSVAFKDQRPRSMIIAQPLGDINDYMQMIGRIDRTGQVHRGYYINLSLPVPAELRFNMMLASKLKSLNANTTTNQESDTGSVDAPDFLNKYGSQVVIEYLRDNPEVFSRLVNTGMVLGTKQRPVTTSAELESYRAGDEDVQKVTGRVALLPVEEQEKFYTDISDRYNALIRYLDETGENTLKITTLPLRAKTLARKIGTEGKDPNGNNPFAQDSYVERVEVDVLRKPMKADEIRKTRENLNGGEDGATHIGKIIDRVNAQEKARLAAEEERYAKDQERVQKEIEKQMAALEKRVQMDEPTRRAERNKITNRLTAEVNQKHESNLFRIKAMHENLRNKFEQFNFNDTYLIHEELEGGNMFEGAGSPALFLGFKTAKEGDSITPSTSVAVFAPLDGRRRLEIKFTESGILDEISTYTNLNYGTARRTNLDNWDSSISNASREVRYILTGNILQAWDDAIREGVLPGRLVSYTDIDGNIHDGILMNQSWQPDQLRSSGAPINSRTEQILNGEAVKSTDGEVEIEREWGDTFSISVPKSKKAGAKYFENEDILKLIFRNQGFHQWRGRFTATVMRDNIPALLNILGAMGVRVNTGENGNAWEEVGQETTAPETNAEADLYREEDNERRGENLSNPIDRARAITTIDRIAKELGVEFEEDSDLQAKGAFSPKTGKIRINIDAHKDTADLEATLLHEAVAHYGLRKLFGKDWKALRMRLYEQASPEIRAKVDAIAKADGLSTEVAMEEYIAQLAEDGRFDAQEESFWQKLVTTLKRLLAKIGINSGYLTDEDFRAMLYASYRNLQTGGALETAARTATAAALRRNADASHEDNGPDDDGPGGGLPADTEEDMMDRESDATAEKRTIKERALADGSFMKAPTGKPTNLKEDQWLTVRTKAFKEWFGDWEKDPRNASKIVDENGEPMVMVHGSRAKFSVFRSGGPFGTSGRGMHFGRAPQNLDEWTYGGSEGYKYLVFLNVRNLYDSSKIHEKNDAGKTLYGPIVQTIIGADSYEQFLNDWKTANKNAPEWANEQVRNVSEKTYQMIHDKYDGKGLFASEKQIIKHILRKNEEYLTLKPEFIGEIVVRDPNQIKSATDNNGNFSTEDPDIYHRNISDLPEETRDLAIDQETEELYRRNRNNATAQTAADAYNTKVRTVGQALREVVVDEYAPVDTLQEAIENESKRKAGDHERVSDHLREIGGRAMDAIRSYNEKFLEPMWDAVGAFRKKAGKISVEEAETYISLKSGLERNEAFAKRDARRDYQEAYESESEKINAEEKEKKKALDKQLNDGDISDVTYQGNLVALQQEMQQKRDKATAKRDAHFADIDAGTDERYKKYREKDYSAITAWAKTDNVADAERAASDFVSDMEQRAGANATKELWKRINAATKETLKFQYEHDMLTRDQYRDISRMLNYYVPMRGFAEDTAEDLFNYYVTSQNTAFQPTVLSAKGRNTLFEGPLGNIGAMHSSAISQGFKNQAKLSLLNLIRNRKGNTIATVTRAWFVKTGQTDVNGNDIYEVAYPQIPEGADFATRQSIIEQFEQDMEQKRANGEAYNAHREVDLHGGVVAFEKEAHKNEHIVQVREGGKEYGIIINGNPAAAQAINGVRRGKSSIDDALNIMRSLTRMLSQMFTTFSVPFWVSNFQRDFGQGLTNTFIRNDKGYLGRYLVNYARAFKVFPLIVGKETMEKSLAKGDPIAKLYQQYLENGGPMGQNRVEDNEYFEQQMKRYLDNSVKMGVIKGAAGVLDAIGRVGEAVETVTRFAVFMTSMESGRPVHQSISDAKEVSTNFARKGSARGFTKDELDHMRHANGKELTKTEKAFVKAVSIGATWFRATIPFFNAAVQGLENKGVNYRNNFTKTLLADSIYFMAGLGMMLLRGDGGGDDDKEKYSHTSDYLRRNNLLLGFGNGLYAKWALPQEYRVCYALGDIVGSAIAKQRPIDDLAIDAFGSLMQLSPAGAISDEVLFSSGDKQKAWENFIVGASPGIAAPVFESIFNRDFKGARLYNEGFNDNNRLYPGWTKKLSTTGEEYVYAAKQLNKVHLLSRDDKKEWHFAWIADEKQNPVKRGTFNLNPAIVEHLVESYFSGPYQIVVRTPEVIGKAVRGEAKLRDIPLVNRLLLNANDNSRDAYYSNMYYYFKGLDTEATRLFSDYKKSSPEHLKELMQTKDYQYMMVFKKYDKIEKAYRKRGKTAENDGNIEMKDNMDEQIQNIHERIAKECLDIYFGKTGVK